MDDGSQNVDANEEMLTQTIPRQDSIMIQQLHSLSNNNGQVETLLLSQNQQEIGILQA